MYVCMFAQNCKCMPTDNTTLTWLSRRHEFSPQITDTTLWCTFNRKFLAEMTDFGNEERPEKN